MEDALAKDLTGAHIKHILEKPPWNLAGNYRSIEKTMMIRRKNERTVLGQLPFANHFQAKEDARDHRYKFTQNEPQECKQTAGIERDQHFRIFRIDAENRVPARSRCAGGSR